MYFGYKVIKVYFSFLFSFPEVNTYKITQFCSNEHSDISRDMNSPKLHISRLNFYDSQFRCMLSRYSLVLKNRRKTMVSKPLTLSGEVVVHIPGPFHSQPSSPPEEVYMCNCQLRTLKRQHLHTNTAKLRKIILITFTVLAVEGCVLWRHLQNIKSFINLFVLHRLYLFTLFKWNNLESESVCMCGSLVCNTSEITIAMRISTKKH